jgi:hypothetical protein
VASCLKISVYYFGVDATVVLENTVGVIGFEVSTVVKIHTVIFCVMTPCRFEDGYYRFGSTCCLHLKDRSRF